jgi:hypothetical protein
MFTTLFDYFSRAWEPAKGWESRPPTAFPREMKTDLGVPENPEPSSGQDINKESPAGAREKGE